MAELESLHTLKIDADELAVIRQIIYALESRKTEKDILIEYVHINISVIDRLCAALE